MVKINRIIKILTASDFAFQIGAGFVAPVFAVFLVKSIENGSVQVVGTATAVYWLTKSVLRLPIAYFLDKKRGEFDDFYSMVIGFLIMTGCYFLYLFAKIPFHIYAIELLMGVGGALAFTPWYGFFTRYIDKHHENLEWSIEVSLAGFGIAGAGFATGIIADKFGFAPVFAIAGIISFAGTLLLFFMGKNLKARVRDGYAREIHLK